MLCPPGQSHEALSASDVVLYYKELEASNCDLGSFTPGPHLGGAVMTTNDSEFGRPRTRVILHRWSFRSLGGHRFMGGAALALLSPERISVNAKLNDTTYSTSGRSSSCCHTSPASKLPYEMNGVPQERDCRTHKPEGGN
jgi:hypothetical protein